MRILQSHYDAAILDIQTQILDMSRALFSENSVRSMNQATEIQQNREVAAAAAASLSSSATMGHRFFIPFAPTRNVRAIVRELQKQQKPPQELLSAEAEDEHLRSTAQMLRDPRLTPKAFLKQLLTRQEKLVVVEYCCKFSAGARGVRGTERAQAVARVVKALSSIANISVTSVKRWILQYEKGNELSDGRPGADALFNADVLKNVCDEIQEVHLGGENEVAYGPQLDALIIRSAKKINGNTPVNVSESTLNRARKALMPLLVGVTNSDWTTEQRNKAIASYAKRAGNCALAWVLFKGARDGVTSAEAKQHPVKPQNVVNMDGCGIVVTKDRDGKIEMRLRLAEDQQVKGASQNTNESNTKNYLSFNWMGRMRADGGRFDQQLFIMKSKKPRKEGDPLGIIYEMVIPAGVDSTAGTFRVWIVPQGTTKAQEAKKLAVWLLSSFDEQRQGRTRAQLDPKTDACAVILDGAPAELNAMRDEIMKEDFPNKYPYIGVYRWSGGTTSVAQWNDVGSVHMNLHARLKKFASDSKRAKEYTKHAAAQGIGAESKTYYDPDAQAKTHPTYVNFLQKVSEFGIEFPKKTLAGLALYRLASVIPQVATEKAIREGVHDSGCGPDPDFEIQVARCRQFRDETQERKDELRELFPKYVKEMEENGRLRYEFLTGEGKAPECEDRTNMPLNRWGATVLTSHVVQAQIREAAIAKEQAAAEAAMKKAQKEAMRQQRAAEKQRKAEESAAKKAQRKKAKEDKDRADAAKKKKKADERAAKKAADREKALNVFSQYVNASNMDDVKGSGCHTILTYALILSDFGVEVDGMEKDALKKAVRAKVVAERAKKQPPPRAADDSSDSSSDGDDSDATSDSASNASNSSSASNASKASLLSLMSNMSLDDLAQNMAAEGNSSPSAGAAAPPRSPPVHRQVHYLRMQAAKRKKMSPHKSQGREQRRKEGGIDIDDDDI